MSLHSTEHLPFKERYFLSTATFSCQESRGVKMFPEPLLVPQLNRKIDAVTVS